jgi:hypothetical protein
MSVSEVQRYVRFYPTISSRNDSPIFELYNWTILMFEVSRWCCVAPVIAHSVLSTLLNPCCRRRSQQYKCPMHNIFLLYTAAQVGRHSGACGTRTRPRRVREQLDSLDGVPLVVG